MSIEEFRQKYNSEDDCLCFLEVLRWGDNRRCPHCNGSKTYKFTNGRLFKCAECRKQFTVTLGTIFSDSKVSLQKWLLTIFILTSAKKGITPTQLSQYIGVTTKTALFMIERIRYATGN